MSRSLLNHLIFNQAYSVTATPILKTMAKNYSDAIAALNSLMSNARYIKDAKEHKLNENNNMIQMEAFLNRLNINLQQLDALKVIHVTGTKGKGTTCCYTENILRSHGYKTGFYSSPHLLEVRERIRLNGVPISHKLFSEYFWTVYKSLDETRDAYDMPAYFCFLTLLAFDIFLKEKVDVAVIEVGIGGEYDYTNIVRNPVVVAITPLDFDHKVLLGDTLESIAWNKGGIMKPGAKAFTVKQANNAMKVLQERSLEKHCPLTIIGDIYSHVKNENIPPHIQKLNASLALSIAKTFIDIDFENGNNTVDVKEFNMELAKKAIESSIWPGRYEIFSRNNSVYYLDGAHTLDSMNICCEWFLSKSVDNQRRRVLIFNAIGERNSENLMKILLKCDFSLVIFIPNVADNNAAMLDNIQPVNDQLVRCQTHKKIWENLKPQSEVQVLASFTKAVKMLEENQNAEYDVLVTGSIHLIGAVMSILDPTLHGIL